MVCFICIFLFSMANSLLSATVKSTIGSREISKGDYTIITINIEGAKGQVEVNHLPQLDGLTLKNSGSSRSLSVVNGKIQSSTTITITVTADKSGTYTIPVFPVIVDGVMYQTKSLSIIVNDTPDSSSKK